LLLTLEELYLQLFKLDQFFMKIHIFMLRQSLCSVVVMGNTSHLQTNPEMVKVCAFVYKNYQKGTQRKLSAH